MHIADWAPAMVFRRYQPSDGSPASTIHRSFEDGIRHQRGRWFGVTTLAASCVWVAYVLGSMMRATWLNGAAIRLRTGKSVVRQVCEQWRVALAHAIAPRWYYGFELFDDDHRRRSAEYLQRGETKRGAYRQLKRAFGGAPSPLTDKVAFAARCRANNLRAIPVLLAIRTDASAASRRDRIRLPAEDLFVKPNHGKGGRGAERWLYRDRDCYEGAEGTVLSESQLVHRLRGLPFEEGLIVQPRRVNHPALADLCNGALATIRIVTCRNEHGRFEITNAVLRMAQGDNHVVDNFHAGGLAAKVDLASGTVGRATDLGLRPDVGWRDTHPDSGAPITGRVVPCWSETLTLVVRAHAAFADRILIGWDVGVMADGPELVEGNGGPDLDIIQRTHREPLGNGRVGQLLAFHLQRLAAGEGLSVVPALSQAS